MLYGDESFRRRVINTGELLCKKFDSSIGRVVFGGVQGSIGKGIQKYDSDYDIRFVTDDLDKNNFFNEGLWTEDVHRFYAEDIERVTDQIPQIDKMSFWGAGCFFNLLLCPHKSERGIRLELYYQVVQTLQSPYVYDPGGTTVKINAIVRHIIDYALLYRYYINVIDKCLEKIYDGKVSDKVYYDACHAVMSAKWICRYRETPPYSFSSLFWIEEKEIKSRIFNIRNSIHSQIVKSSAEQKTYKLKMSRDIKFNDDYLDQYLTQSINCLSRRNLSFERVAYDEQIRAIACIYDIIREQDAQIFVKGIKCM